MESTFDVSQFVNRKKLFSRRYQQRDCKLNPVEEKGSQTILIWLCVVSSDGAGVRGWMGGGGGGFVVFRPQLCMCASGANSFYEQNSLNTTFINHQPPRKIRNVEKTWAEPIATLPPFDPKSGVFQISSQ